MVDTKARQSGQIAMIPKYWDGEADVLVVGSGYSGLAATIESRNLGMTVILLEKMLVPGGNSVRAGGGVNAVDPARQERQAIIDSCDLHFTQTMSGGDGINDPEKVRFMVEHSLEDCVIYLEKLGVVWPDKVIRGYGALHERTHYPPMYTDRKRRKWKAGAAIIHAMLDRLEIIGQQTLYNHKVTRIIREHPLEGRVIGVEVDAYGKILYLRARRAVILASGGFASNLEWVMKHDRRLANTGTTNHSGATGECIKHAEDIGADTLHMDYIQAIPLVAVMPPFKAMFHLVESEEVRKASPSLPYRIFVNRDGMRFVDEGARRDVIKTACLKQLLFEPKRPAKCRSIQELEAKLDLPKGSLVETVERYNAACKAKNDRDFGKDESLLVPLKTPPFIAHSRAIQRHHTMGGLLVKGTTGEVIDRWGKIILGLYAAGEVTGGTHGTNRLGHNGTTDCLVFGQNCARAVVCHYGENGLA